MTKISPLAPKAFPALPAVPGVAAAAASAGVRQAGKPDVFLASLAPGTQAAGVLTRSRTAAAPVDWCRRALRRGRARAVIVNSGNANAFTGIEGDRSVRRTADKVAASLGCPASQVFVASTGVIGETLPDDRIRRSVDALRDALRPDAWKDAAAAIMTTDTFPKGAVRRTAVGRDEVVVAGIAKGSGMIAPDMATMLAFVFTDAAVSAAVLRRILRPGIERSFNAITVDGDTSTSDTALLFATGAAGHRPITDAADRRLPALRAALDEVLLDLAHQVVRDGEGASKFVTVRVAGAQSDRAARAVALSVANSPLVKTAVAGEDANWGRIVMAVGKSGERADRDRLRISVGGTRIADRGRAVRGYDEAPVARHMKGREIDIDVDLRIGRGKATVWTCDLTHGYISINADYRS